MNQSIVVEEPTANQPGVNPSGTAQQQPPADDIPEKYRGKSLNDVIAMHSEAEKRLGGLRDEVGQWRSLTETLAQTRAPVNPSANTTTDDLPSEDDFFKSPIEATRKLIEAAISSRVDPVAQRVDNLAGQGEFEKFRSDYPDFETKVRTEDFRSWAGRSQGRLADAAAAAKGDMRAARRLMEDWTEIEALSGNATAQPTREADPGIEAARAASTDTGGRRSAPVGKATFTRAEIVDMIVKNPTKYESMQAEIQAAIREGRVSGF